jgi:hypothetical protein
MRSTCHPAGWYPRQIDASEPTADNKATGDAVGVFLLGIPFSKLSGDFEGEIAQLKGELEALDTAQVKAKCKSVDSVTAYSGRTGELPYQTEKMRSAYEDYQNKPWSRAFAISVQGGYGRAWSHRTPDLAREDALNFCEQKASVKGSCFIYSVNNQVVWKR